MIERFLPVFGVVFCVALVSMSIPAVSAVSSCLVAVSSIAVTVYAGLEHLR